MKKATLTETKNNLSSLIDLVRHGETVLILDRGRPVARLESVLKEGTAPEGRLERLERLGLARRAVSPAPRDVLNRKPPAPSPKASVVATLVAERRTGR